jgi:hypothetical protein
MLANGRSYAVDARRFFRTMLEIDLGDRVDFA